MGTSQTANVCQASEPAIGTSPHSGDARLDMTQEAFRRTIGISQIYLSTIERGRVEIGAEDRTQDRS